MNVKEMNEQELLECRKLIEKELLKRKLTEFLEMYKEKRGWDTIPIKSFKIDIENL